MDKQAAIKFGTRSANMAFDQRHDPMHGGLQSSIATYRENVRDTLNDENASEFEDAALAAFDKRVAELSGAEDAEWQAYQDGLEFAYEEGVCRSYAARGLANVY